MAALVVTVLRAQVKVLRTTPDGEQIMEPTGGLGNDGKPILRKASRIVTLRRGETLPDDLADGELDRLKRLEVVGTEVPKPGEIKMAADPKAAELAFDLDKLGDYSVEDLTAAFKKQPVGVQKLVAQIGTDKDLANRVLEAEKASQSEPRKTLVEAIEKLQADGSQS